MNFDDLVGVRWYYVDALGKANDRLFALLGVPLNVNEHVANPEFGSLSFVWMVYTRLKSIDQ